MVQDRIKLLIDTVGHDLRRVLAIHAVHLPQHEFLQAFGGVLDFRREQPLGKQFEFFHHIRDGTGIGHDYFLRRLLPEIFEFLQHLLRGTEIDGAIAVRIGKSLGGLHDMTVLLVLRIQKMDIGSGDDRFVHASSQFDDTAVIVLQHMVVLHDCIIHEEAVINERLDLKIIIELRDLLQSIPVFPAHHSAVQFSHAAGGTDEKTFPMLDQQRTGHRRSLVEVFQIGLRDQLIQVLQSLLVSGKYDHMAGPGQIRTFELVIDRLDIVHGLCPMLPKHRQELRHDLCHHHGIIRCAVVIEFRQLQMIGHHIQLEALHIRQQCLRQCQCVQIDR